MINKLLSQIFIKTNQKQFSVISENQIMAIVYQQDDVLKLQENKFVKQLSKYFEQLQLFILNQSEKIFNTGKIFIGKKAVSLLEKLFENYFLVIDKIAYSYNLKILKGLIPKLNKSNYKDIIKAKKNLNRLKKPVLSFDKKEYAREISSKEIQDLKEIILNKVKDISPYFSIKDIWQNVKNKIADGFNKFKSRLSNIATTEANRVTNERIGENAKELNFVEAIKFVAVLDDKTTQICWSRHGLIVTVEYFNKYMKPPLHYHCRSVGVPIGKWNKYELSKAEDLKRLPEPW